MKIYALVIIMLMVIFETLAFTVFHYPKSTGWWAANVALIAANILSVAMIENSNEAVPDRWKVYVPALLIIALIILVVLPQASTFNQ